MEIAGNKTSTAKEAVDLLNTSGEAVRPGRLSHGWTYSEG